ncbi:hypothetical protein JS87_09770 [Vibrio vulnificus]|nr:hypothetical protein JS87_09770 [Vibrio vulnificus]KFK56590.1 hypothetical protein JS86_05485 [Vibrio vulnificus]
MDSHCKMKDVKVKTIVTLTLLIFIVGCEEEESQAHLKKICNDESCIDLRISSSCIESRGKIIDFEKKFMDANLTIIKNTTDFNLLLDEHEKCLLKSINDTGLFYSSRRYSLRKELDYLSFRRKQLKK